MAQGKLVGGVRMKHATLHDCMYVVPVIHRRYKVPVLCGICNTSHDVKTYHLQLDNEGCCIVSDTIATRLKEIGGADLQVLNVVRTPPDQKMSMDLPGGQRGRFKVVEKKVG